MASRSCCGSGISSQARYGSGALAPAFLKLMRWSSRKMRQSRAVMFSRAFSLQCFSRAVCTG